MAASGIIARSGSADTTASLFAPYFSGYSTPYAQCDSIVLQAGAEPSYAMCRVPLAALDDTAPAVAAVRGGPVGGGIRIGDNASIADGNGTTVLVGTVTTITHLLGDRPGEDCAIVKVEDARRKLKKFPIVGSFWRSGTVSSPSIAYRQGWPPIFNQGAQPNCIFVNNIPVFCESNYGLKSGQVPGPMGRSSTVACFWDNATMLQYYRYIATTGASVARANFPEYPLPITSFTWPSGYSSAILPVTVKPQNGATPNRKAPETNADSVNLADAITSALHSEGSWDMYITPNNALTVVPTKYTSGGTSLYMPTGDANTEMAKPKIITGGVLIEDGENLYNRAWSAGEITMIETRISTGSGFEKAWDQDDFDFVQTKAQAFYNDNVAIDTAIQRAVSFRPNVLRLYRLTPTFNFQAGTPETGKPRADVGRPLLDTLLTSRLEGDTAVNATALYRFRFPTRFEVFIDTATPPAWSQASLSDGFEVDASGTVRLDGLFNAASNYKVDISGSQPNATVTITPRDLRVSVAIPCDHKLLASAISPLGEDDRISPNVTDVYYASTNLYAREYRGGTNKSWPIPESAQDASAAAAFPNGYLRNDIDYLQSHANRRADIYARLVRGGQFVCPSVSMAFEVGQQISIFTGSRNGFPIRSVIRCLDIKSSPDEQNMIIHTDDAGFLGFDDLSEITSSLPPAPYQPEVKPAQAAKKPGEYGQKAETNYGSTAGYGAQSSAKSGYTPSTSESGNASSAAPKGSVAAQKAQESAIGGDEEDRGSTGNGAASEADSLKNTQVSPLEKAAGDLSKRNEASTATEPAKKSSGQGDEMLKNEFGV